MFDEYQMADPQDIVDIEGLRAQRMGSSLAADRPKQPFLSVWFRCCHVYGRMNRDVSGTRYEGRCPSCGAAVHARIGPGGTARRTFEAI